MARPWFSRATAMGSGLMIAMMTACSESEDEHRGSAAGTGGRGAQGGASGSSGVSGNSGASGAAGSSDGASGSVSSDGSADSAATGGASGDSGSSTGGTAGTAGGQGGSTGSSGTAGGAGLPPSLTWKQESNEVIEEIWGSSTGDIYAVGRSGTLLHSAGDGTWQTLNSGTGANLTGVWGSGPNDVYVSVDANVILHGPSSGEWEHQVLDSGYTFTAIGGTGPNDVYALGPGAMHRSAGGWERPPQSVASGGVPMAIWGSSPTNLYITCAGACASNVYHSAGNGTWRTQNAPRASEANGIFGLGPDQIYIATTGGILFSTGDGNWTTQLTSSVRAVWAADRHAVYTCGSAGLFYRSNGEGAWSEGQAIDATRQYICRTIWGTGPDNIYVGGSGIYRGTPVP